jgi:hypothetical protein
MNRRTFAALAMVTLTLATCLALAGVALGASNVPAWWIDRGEPRVKAAEPAAAPAANLPPWPAIEYFTVVLTANDHNSGLMPPGLEFRVPAWMPPIYADWRVGSEVLLWVDRATHATDGIIALDYRATDRAGNTMSASVPVMIDTRPPVTDGDKDWVNGLVPYVLTATDQVPGSGVAATVYRVDQSTPWLVNEAASVAPTLATSISLTGGQDSLHTIDFASVDAALPFSFVPSATIPSWHFGNWEMDILNILQTGAAYKSRTVKLDVTAPVVTAMDPKNGNWQQGPAVVNFSGTDAGAGYAYTEWSTDGGATWTQGESAEIGGDSPVDGTVVSYRGVDKVGIMSAVRTITVKVATTAPTVTGADASVTKGQKAQFHFNVTAVTPTARVIIEIRTMRGRTLMTHTYDSVATGSDQMKQFRVNLKKGRHYIRISAVDLAGNHQSMRGKGTLTVK